MLLGMLVVLTWHSCLRLPLPSEGVYGTSVSFRSGIGSQQETSHLSQGLTILVGAHDWLCSRCIPTIWGRCSQPTLQGQPQNRGQTPSSCQSP